MTYARTMLGGIAVATLAMVAPATSAAILTLDSITRVNSGTTTVDLTNTGTTDWAYWSTTGTGLASPVVPNNEKLGGTAISGASNVGGTTLRGSASSATTLRYSYTGDGTSPTSAAGVNANGLLFNSDLGTSAVNKGVSVTLAGDTAVTRTANLYFGGFAATGVLTLTLNGATTIVDAPQVFANSSPKGMAVFVISYRPDNVSDVLTASWVATAVT
ncbi:MAG: hypothetical protein ACAI43_12910, partial [Phycisphaerae bacterium]